VFPTPHIPHPTPVWLIGGTQESAQLAIALLQAHIPCVITVTTETARSLYPHDPLLQIWVGRLNEDSLRSFIHQHHICAILDASHPFAVEISQLAIAMAERFQLPYLRYERGVGCGVQGVETNEVRVESFEALLATNLLENQRVLLTIGYRPFALFKPWQERTTLFARILPSAIALQSALESGFTPDRLIAIRPPISAELEQSLWHQWHISMVVTKASGAPGGEDIKREIARELGVKLVVVDRPAIAYPQQTSDVAIALSFCQEHGTRQIA
jgi:precorrin-6A/cobalt-precorrin-6A reductase